MSQLYEQVEGFCGTRGSELELCYLGLDGPLPLKGLISDHFISEGSELFARFRVLGEAAERLDESEKGDRGREALDAGGNQIPC